MKVISYLLSSQLIVSIMNILSFAASIVCFLSVLFIISMISNRRKGIRYKSFGKMVLDFYQYIRMESLGVANKVLVLIYVLSIVATIISSPLMQEIGFFNSLYLEDEGYYSYTVRVDSPEYSGEYPARIEVVKEKEDLGDGRNKTYRYYYIHEIVLNDPWVIDVDGEYCGIGNTIEFYDENDDYWECTLINEHSISPYIEETDRFSSVDLVIAIIKVIAHSFVIIMIIAVAFTKRHNSIRRKQHIAEITQRYPFCAFCGSENISVRCDGDDILDENFKARVFCNHCYKGWREGDERIWDIINGKKYKIVGERFYTEKEIEDGIDVLDEQKRIEEENKRKEEARQREKERLLRKEEERKAKEAAEQIKRERYKEKARKEAEEIFSDVEGFDFIKTEEDRLEAIKDWIEDRMMEYDFHKYEEEEKRYEKNTHWDDEDDFPW